MAKSTYIVDKATNIGSYYIKEDEYLSVLSEIEAKNSAIRKLKSEIVAKDSAIAAKDSATALALNLKFRAIAAKDSAIAAKDSATAAKDSEIRNLKSEMNAQTKELENLNNFAGQLYGEKEFVDVKIVCNEKTFDGHKTVLSCRSEVFKTMIRNKSLTEKQAEVMEINENDFNSETMEQVLFYFYHGNVQDTKMINTNLLRAADKYEVVGLMDMCARYLESNLSLENALDVLVTSELTNQKGLFDCAAKFVRENKGKMNKTARERSKIYCYCYGQNVRY